MTIRLLQPRFSFRLISRHRFYLGGFLLLNAGGAIVSCSSQATELIGGTLEPEKGGEASGGESSLGGAQGSTGGSAAGTGGEAGAPIEAPIVCDSPGTCIVGRGVDIGGVSPGGSLYRDADGTVRFPEPLPAALEGLDYASFDAYPDYSADDRGYSDNKDSRTDEVIERLKSDVAGPVLIALNDAEARGDGWERVGDGRAPDFSLLHDELGAESESLGYFFYRHENAEGMTWIELPEYSASSRPPFVFSEPGNLYFANPLPIPRGVEIARSGLIANPSMTVIPGSFDGDGDGFGDGDVDRDGKVDVNVYLANCSGVSLWKVWRSIDEGATWERWSKPSMNINRQTIFWHNDNVYVMGWVKHPDRTDDPSAQGIIYRSADGGRTFIETTLLPFDAGDAPSNIAIHDGRIWKAVSGPDAAGDKGPTLASAPVDSNLMDPNSWTVAVSTSFQTIYNRNPSQNDIEGVTLLTREGRVANVAISDGSPRSIAFTYAKGTTETEFDPAQDIGNLHQLGKMSIQFDAVSDKYWALTNEGQPRNVLNLYSSEDLKSYTLEGTALSAPSSRFHGFNYPHLIIEGDDIIFVSRTAFEDDRGQPGRWHDATLFTFHRLKNFRTQRP